jgi:hypothetical protein
VGSHSFSSIARVQSQDCSLVAHRMSVDSYGMSCGGLLDGMDITYSNLCQMERVVYLAVLNPNLVSKMGSSNFVFV